MIVLDVNEPTPKYALAEVYVGGKKKVYTISDDLTRFIPDDLSRAKAIKGVQISMETESKIKSGYESSALGTPHLYSSNITDQINIIGAVVAGVSLPFGCYDVNAMAKVVPVHTAAQLQQVFTDGVTKKQTDLTEYRTRIAAMAAATTVAEVEAI